MTERSKPWDRDSIQVANLLRAPALSSIVRQLQVPHLKGSVHRTRDKVQFLTIFFTQIGALRRAQTGNFWTERCENDLIQVRKLYKSYQMKLSTLKSPKL